MLLQVVCGAMTLMIVQVTAMGLVSRNRTLCQILVFDGMGGQQKGVFRYRLRVVENNQKYAQDAMDAAKQVQCLPRTYHKHSTLSMKIMIALNYGWWCWAETAVCAPAIHQQVDGREDRLRYTRSINSDVEIVCRLLIFSPVTRA